MRTRDVQWGHWNIWVVYRKRISNKLFMHRLYKQVDQFFFCSVSCLNHSKMQESLIKGLWDSFEYKIQHFMPAGSCSSIHVCYKNLEAAQRRYFDCLGWRVSGLLNRDRATLNVGDEFLPPLLKFVGWVLSYKHINFAVLRLNLLLLLFNATIFWEIIINQFWTL